MVVSDLYGIDAMKNVKEDFIRLLIDKPHPWLVTVWIIDRVPYVFKGDAGLYAEWRHDLAKNLGVDASALVITGSGAFGVSLNPDKNYKYFDDDSDIDVAIVSEHHFNVGWRTIRNLGSKFHKLSPLERASIVAHQKNYIYWGTIATDRILGVMPFGQEWSKALSEMANVDPTKGRTINARIYKDFDSLRAYQVFGLKTLMNNELER